MTRLLDAIDALTKPRKVPTVIEDDDTGAWLYVHTEPHDPLLVMLVAGISTPGQTVSNDPGIPIDAEALEIVQEIRGTIRSWMEALEQRVEVTKLGPMLRRYYAAHVNAYRAGEITETADLAVTRIVEGWVHRIEQKFDPPEKREWTEPCPGTRTIWEDGEPVSTRVCEARRIVRDGAERFAIILNVTTLTAECDACGTRWEGEAGLLQLRKATDLRALITDTGADERDETFLRHAAETGGASTEQAC